MLVTIAELKGNSVRLFGPKLADVTKWTDPPIHEVKSNQPGEVPQLELPADTNKIFVAYFANSPYEVPLNTGTGAANRNLVTIHVGDTYKGSVTLSGLPAGADTAHSCQPLARKRQAGHWPQPWPQAWR